MDDEFQDFTELGTELRELRPVALSNDLIRRVDRALAKPISSPLGATTHGVFEWLAWPIAASFVGTVAWLSNGAMSRTKNTEAAENAAVTANYKPVGTENILYDVREEGLTTLADGTPAKQIRDRKSTRLNSSHSQISYAVFCLQKNKNTNTNYRRIPPSRVYHFHEADGHTIG